MVRLGELMMILELHRQGVSVTAIARRTGRDPKTVRKYIERGVEAPVYGPRSVSVAGNGQRRPVAATRSNVSATVLRPTVSDRAIARSVAPHSCLRRRISRTRRISAGIGPPARRCRDE